MGLFDWLFGKPKERANSPTSENGLGKESAPGPRPPKILGEFGTQVLIDTGNGMTTIMDRETYEYMYGGGSGAPDPTQRDLDSLLPKVSRVRVLASGIFRGRAMHREVVLDVADADAVAALRQTLQIVDDPGTFARCACLGGPTLELLAGDELLASIGLQHGHSIRWANWKHDARLRDGNSLTEWLKRNGAESDLLDLLLHNGYDAGGMMPVGFRRLDGPPLSRAEQQVRVAEVTRARGGDLGEALARCQRVIDAGEPPAMAFFVRAMIRRQRDDLAGCEADLSEAVRLGLREVDVLYQRAVVRDALGRPDDALADCSAALELAPDFVNALNSRGFILSRLNRLAEAAADLERANRLAPEWPLPYLNLARVRLMDGNPRDGLTLCDTAVELLTKSSEQADRNTLAGAYMMRARCHAEAGDRPRAEADYQAAVKINPAVANAG